MENNDTRFQKLYRLISLYPELEMRFQEAVGNAEDSSQLEPIIDEILNSELKVDLYPSNLNEILPFRKNFWHSLKKYARKGEKPDYTVGASYDAQKILAGFEDLQSVGYCLILQEGDATELAELFIDEKYRGLGLSKKAMAYVLDTYPSDELYIMVHKPNTISQKLIQEYGFKPVAQESNNLIRFERYD